jgi:hypothetical protein
MELHRARPSVPTSVLPPLALAALALALGVAAAPAGAATRVVAWNNLGMHCRDDSFAVFSLLPPYNTLLAQVTRDGVLVADPTGLEVTYHGVADPSGSINTTSQGKTDFWQHVVDLFGVSLPPDAGANLGTVQVAVPEPGAGPGVLAAAVVLAGLARARR